MKDYCYRCHAHTETKVIHHPSGTEWQCAACGWQVDFMFDEQFDDDEPVGSCDNCGSNIYADEADSTGLCDQCQFYSASSKD